MAQSIMSCKEKFTLTGETVECCQREREHRGPHRFVYVVRGIRIEIKWEEVEEKS